MSKKSHRISVFPYSEVKAIRKRVKNSCGVSPDTLAVTIIGGTTAVAV